MSGPGCCLRRVGPPQQRPGELAERLEPQRPLVAGAAAWAVAVVEAWVADEVEEEAGAVLGEACEPARPRGGRAWIQRKGKPIALWKL